MIAASGEADRSVAQSFAGQLDVFKREYLFVLIAAKNGIRQLADPRQHGTRRSPAYLFDVLEGTSVTSETLDRHSVHRVLQHRLHYNGPPRR